MAGEKIFEEKVKRYLESKGIYRLGTPKNKMSVTPVGYYEKRFANAYTGAGLPDMHIVVKGISVEAELKQATGRPSDLQVIKIQRIIESGGIAFILYPKDFELFKDLINEIIRENYDCKAAERSSRFGK